MCLFVCARRSPSYHCRHLLSENRVIHGFSLRAVAGQYTCKEGKNSPCLIYVSFSHKIYIYWKVELERMESTNLLRVLEEKPELKRHLKVLGVGEYTRSSVMRKLIGFRLEQTDPPSD